MQWPYPAGKTSTETSRLYEDGVFQTEGGRARLFPVEWEPFPEQPRRAGLLFCAAAIFAGAALLLVPGSTWRVRWNVKTADRAGVFCIRGLIWNRQGIAYD